MIIRNFLKNKINLIYALIVFILFWLIVLIVFLDNRRTIYYNEHNENAYIVFEDNYSKYDRVKNIDIIDNVILGIRTSTKPGGNNDIFISDKLNGNEFIANSGIFFDEKVGDTVTLARYNIELVIVDKVSSYNNESYMSEELFDSIIDESDNTLYMVTLRDWSNLGECVSEINKLSLMGVNHVRVNGYFEDTNYDTRYYIFRTILIGIVLIGFYFVFKSIYTHEKDKSYMYYCLGFTKGELVRWGILKVLLLFVLAFLPFILLYSLILL